MFNYDKLSDAIDCSGKTKTYLCQKLGRPAYYLRDVIKQKNAIPADYQIILAHELGVTVEYLNDREDKKDQPTPESELVNLTNAEKKVLDLFRKIPEAERDNMLLAVEVALRSRGLLG